MLYVISGENHYINNYINNQTNHVKSNVNNNSVPCFMDNYKSQNSIAEYLNYNKIQDTSKDVPQGSPSKPEGMDQETYDLLCEMIGYDRNERGSGKVVSMLPAADEDVMGRDMGCDFSSELGYYYELKYTDDSTTENPCVIAEGYDENGNIFREKININDIDLNNATRTEITAFMAHNKLTTSSATLHWGAVYPINSNHGVHEKVNAFGLIQGQIDHNIKVGPMAAKNLREMLAFQQQFQEAANEHGQVATSSSTQIADNCPSYLKYSYSVLSYNNYMMKS